MFYSAVPCAWIFQVMAVGYSSAAKQAITLWKRCFRRARCLFQYRQLISKPH